MATVSTTYGTYLEDLFNPQVIADLINAKLIDKIAFAPLATIDTTLQGHAGDTVTLPYYAYIGAAEDVAEGTDIPIAKLTQSTKQVRIEKIGKGVQFTDEALLSGYGDPLGEGVNQVVTAIADKLDKKLLDAANHVTTLVYNTDELEVSDIPLALALFGEDNEGTKIIVCDANFYAKLVKSDWIPASEIAAEVRIKGVVGMTYGCQVLVSDRVRNGNFFIMKDGALAIFMKRDTMVERDRDIVNQSTVVVGSKLFAPYVLNENKIIKMVAGIDKALKPITLEAAAGTNTGDTVVTLSGYSPAAGESYFYAVGDKPASVALGQPFAGTAFISGSTQITADAAKYVTVVSVDADGKAVAAGTVRAVPKE